MKKVKYFVVSAAVVLLLSACQSNSNNDPTIQGAWQPQTYLLKNGDQLSVDGLIFFTEKDWTVLFFVLDQNGTPKRGSGEGGTYTLNEKELVFSHRYHLSAGEPIGSLPASPLKMEIKKAVKADAEPCTIEIKNGLLKIFFPSGNAMTFKRSSGFGDGGKDAI